ncbi:MAG: DUF4330 domain-containing protein [Oscillospiraceae bacterium]|nr:DUF4330 domain-containing protein [Oscillospiraceae bacterium]
MKIINEKGKLFGLINLVDLLMLVTLAVVVVAGAVFFLGGGEYGYGAAKQEEASEPYFVEVAFTVQVQNVRPEVAENLLAAIPRFTNTPYVVGADYLPNFFFVDAWSEPTVVLGSTADGEPVATVDPRGHQDVWFESRGLLLEPEVPIYSMISQEIRLGQRFWVKSRLIEADGTLVDFVVSDPIHLDDIDFEFGHHLEEGEEFSIDDPATWGWEPDPSVVIIDRGQRG